VDVQHVVVSIALSVAGSFQGIGTRAPAAADAWRQELSSQGGRADADGRYEHAVRTAGAPRVSDIRPDP